MGRKISLLVFLAILFCPLLAFGQAGRFDNTTNNLVGRPIGGINVSVCANPGMATTAATVTSNTVVLTMATNPVTAGFVANMTLIVAGFTGGDTYLNGTFPIVSVTPTTIVYIVTHANASASSNGTAMQIGNATYSCAPLVTTYTNYLATTPIANPSISDGMGNFGFWTTPGQYFYQVYGSGVTTTIKFVTTGIGSGGGSSCPAGADTDVQTNHPLGTCYGSGDFTFNDTTHNLQAGNGINGPNTIATTASDVFVFGQINSLGGAQSPAFQNYVFGQSNNIQNCGNQCGFLGDNNTTGTGAGSLGAVNTYAVGSFNTIDGIPSTAANSIYLMGLSNSIGLSSSIEGVGEGNSIVNTGGTGGITHLQFVGHANSFTSTSTGTLGHMQVFGFQNAVSASVDISYLTIAGNVNTATGNASSGIVYGGIYGNNETLTSCQHCYLFGDSGVLSSNNTIGIGLSATPELLLTTTNLTSSINILPIANNTYNLGSASVLWNNTFANNANMNLGLFPELGSPAGTSATAVLGATSSNHWLKIIDTSNANVATAMDVCALTGARTAGHVAVFVDSADCIMQDGGTTSGGGSVTSFAAPGSPCFLLFTCSVATPTTTPSLTFTIANFAAHKWYGNPSASTGAPIISLIGASDVSPNAYVAGGGAANVQTASLTPAATALTAGLSFCWLPVAANTTTTPTMNLNGLGAATITKFGTTALVANDIITTAIACAIYDGTDWELQNPQTSAVGANAALSNLASVAINTALLPGTTNSIALGSATKTWTDLFLGNATSYSHFSSIATAPRLVTLPDAASATAQAFAASAGVFASSFSATTGAFGTKTLTSTSGASGMTFSDSGTAVTVAPSNVTGGGNSIQQCTSTGIRAGDYLGYNATPICVNTTPGININSQTSSTYTVVSSDRGKVITANYAAGVMAVTLPQANSTGFDTNFFFCIQNLSSTALTITPTTSTINGATSLTIQGGTALCVNSDNTNYFARETGSAQTLGTLIQTAQTTATGSPVNVVSSVPFTGNYQLAVYLDEDAPCTVVGGGLLTSVITWTDARTSRTDTFTLTPDTSSGLNSYSRNLINVWAVSGSAITVTNTYVACGTGTWSYDMYAYAVHN